LGLHPGIPGMGVKLRIAVQKDGFLVTGFFCILLLLLLFLSSKYGLISKKEVEWLGRKYEDIISNM
jgi:hypothetical protein